jgi:hypothetical protein
MLPENFDWEFYLEHYEDYNKIMKKIGITNLPLPHINQSTNGDYKNFYTDKDIEKVYNMCKKDIDYFGYQF